MFLYTVAGQAITPFIPLQARHLGMRVGTIGLLLGVQGIAALLASLFGGLWLGALGPRRLVFWGSVLSVGALGVVWLWPTVAVLVLVLPVVWAVWAVTAIASQTLVLTRAHPQARDHAVGMHAFYSSLGMTVGPLLGSAAVRLSGGIAAVFLVAALATVLASIVALFAQDPGRLEFARPRSPFAGIFPIQRHVTLALGGVLVAELCYVGWSTFFPLVMQTAGRTPEFIGGVFAVNGVVLAAIRPGLARVVLRLSRQGVLVASLGLFAVGLWLALFPHSILFTLGCAALLGLGVGLIFPTTILLVSAGSEGELLGRLLSVRFLMVTLGQMLGPALTGVVAGVSLTGALGAAGALAAGTGVWAFAYARSGRFLDTRKSAMLP